LLLQRHRKRGRGYLVRIPCPEKESDLLKPLPFVQILTKEVVKEKEEG